MTLWLFFTICVLASSVNGMSIADKAEGIKAKNDGWMVPTAEGALKWLSTSEANELLEAYESINDLEINGRISLNAVKFYLYTQSNPTKGKEISTSKQSIDASNFNPENPTRITIHGWNSNYKDGVNTKVRDAWFLYGDYNMIAVDWARGRSLEYASSVAAVSSVGAKIAKLVDFLVEDYGMSLETLEIVGFSLGAQVAGHTAKQVTTGKVQKVVGLDPAMPLISYDKPNNRLSSDDAVYVESIQTCGGVLGYTQPIGRAAFYPNGGKTQPGCGIDLTGSCSHKRAVSYYVESLTMNNFPTIRCPSYQEANSKDCGSNYSTVRMGSPQNIHTAFGEFYVPVNKQSPYGLGDPNEIIDETTTSVPEQTTEPVESTTESEDINTTLTPVDDSTISSPGSEITSPTTTISPTTVEPEDGDTTIDDSTISTPGNDASSPTTVEPEVDTTIDDSTISTPGNDASSPTTVEPEADTTIDDSTISSPGNDLSSPPPTITTTTVDPEPTDDVPTTSTPGTIVTSPPEDEDDTENDHQTNIYIINLIYVKAQINKNLSEA